VYDSNHIQNSIEIHTTLVAMATVHTRTGNFHDFAVFSIRSAARNMGLNGYISVAAEEGTVSDETVMYGY
jgi:hypothetical protein